MDDLFGKMQSVLSDPESMKQLQELAALMGSDEKSEDDKTAQNEESSEDSGFDIGKLLELTSMMNSSKNDDDTALLLALKPHLKEERQKKIDKAVKLMKLLDVFKTLKNAGMLKDFL
ncbi:MAG: hypothetical protein K2H01_06490 [Ruminococcus sp.]|nr:hypothetical protein [Ruminococcus sp.]